MAGLFETPEQVRARIGKTGREQDLTLAGLSGTQRANLGGATAGRLFAQAVQGENPEVARARGIQESMQSAQLEAGDDVGKFYSGLAKNLKKQGFVNESMKALQALQAHNNQQAKIDQANRKVAAQEKTAEASETRAETGAAESIPGKARLAIMVKNAESAALKARAAMTRALVATGAEKRLRGFKSQAVSTQNIKSVGTQLSNDSVFQRLDEGEQQGTYVGTIAQSANDLVAFGKSRGKTITFSQAMTAVKAIADTHVSNNSFFDDTFDKQAFQAEFLSNLQ